VSLAQQVFDMKDYPGAPTGFMFVCPGVWIGDDDVSVRRADGLWHLAYTDMDEVTFEASHDNMTAALLMLAAKRLGFNATMEVE
jgi:hypothetical protein